MDTQEFIGQTPADTGRSYCSGYGIGDGSGSFDGRGADGFGSGKCIELINGSGFGSGYGDGCGTEDGTGR